MGRPIEQPIQLPAAKAEPAPATQPCRPGLHRLDHQFTRPDGTVAASVASLYELPAICPCQQRRVDLLLAVVKNQGELTLSMGALIGALRDADEAGRLRLLAECEARLVEALATAESFRAAVLESESATIPPSAPK